MMAAERYVPAAGRAGLTRLYDPVIALTMRERAFRGALVAAVLAAPRPSVALDLGCGTGTLLAELLRADRSLQVLAVDGDEAVLARAREKTAKFGRRVRLQRGMVDDLAIDDGSVDVVTASLLLHHLAPAAKRRALAEARRVLRPQGRLLIVDWGKAQDLPTRAAFLMLQLLDGFANTRDHAAGRLPGLIDDAGFQSVELRARWRTIWGSLELIAAQRA